KSSSLSKFRYSFLVAAELLLERYRMEFVNYTSECPNAMALRWAMLRLYEKRVAKTAVKIGMECPASILEDEVFVVYWGWVKT
ncbi:hypothetical protein HNY73_011677, partial [Argiope bruennichi]